MKKTAIFLTIILALGACWTQSDKWTGFYYPEGEPTYGKAIFETQEFETQKLCEEWGIEKTQGNEEADFFCGFQCKYNNTGQHGCRTPQEEANEGFKSFSSETLGLSFQYPAQWEEITEGTDHGHFILKTGAYTFLAADSYPYDGPDRGFGWTDLSQYIESQEFLNNFCDQPIFPDDVQECEIVQNPNGVTYAKTLEELHAEGGLLGLAYNYYIFNPHSEEFSGIVISTIWLDENWMVNPGRHLDDLMDSLSFI